MSEGGGGVAGRGRAPCERGGDRALSHLGFWLARRAGGPADGLRWGRPTCGGGREKEWVSGEGCERPLLEEEGGGEGRACLLLLPAALPWPVFARPPSSAQQQRPPPPFHPPPTGRSPTADTNEKGGSGMRERGGPCVGRTEARATRALLLPTAPTPRRPRGTGRTRTSSGRTLGKLSKCGCRSGRKEVNRRVVVARRRRAGRGQPAGRGEAVTTLRIAANRWQEETGFDVKGRESMRGGSEVDLLSEGEDEDRGHRPARRARRAARRAARCGQRSALAPRHLAEQRTLLPEAVMRLGDGTDAGLGGVARRGPTNRAVRAGAKGGEIGHSRRASRQGSARAGRRRREYR